MCNDTMKFDKKSNLLHTESQLYLKSELNPDTFQELKELLDHKIMREEYSDFIDYLPKKQQMNVKDCASYLAFSKYENNNGDIRRILKSANFCKHRLCVMCQYRKARKLSFELLSRIQQMQEDIKNLDALMITLTVPNCKLENLKDTLKQMSKAFHKFIKRKEIAKVCLGFFKALEFFGDETPVGYAHPHYHILFLVRRSYFKKAYISQERWTQFWSESYGQDNLIVDVRRIKAKEVKKPEKEYIIPAFLSAVLEVCKYSLKGTEVNKLEGDNMRSLIRQTKSIRSYAVGGKLSDYEPQLDKLDESIWQYIEDEFYYYSKAIKSYKLVEPVRHNNSDL